MYIDYFRPWVKWVLFSLLIATGLLAFAIDLYIIPAVFKLNTNWITHIIFFGYGLIAFGWASMVFWNIREHRKYKALGTLKTMPKRIPFLLWSTLTLEKIVKIIALPLVDVVLFPWLLKQSWSSVHWAIHLTMWSGTFYNVVLFFALVTFETDQQVQWHEIKDPYLENIPLGFKSAFALFGLPVGTWLAADFFKMVYTQGWLIHIKHYLIFAYIASPLVCLGVYMCISLYKEYTYKKFGKH